MAGLSKRRMLGVAGDFMLVSVAGWVFGAILFAGWVGVRYYRMFVLPGGRLPASEQ